MGVLALFLPVDDRSVLEVIPDQLVETGHHFAKRMLITVVQHPGMCSWFQSWISDHLIWVTGGPTLLLTQTSGFVYQKSLSRGPQMVILDPRVPRVPLWWPKWISDHLHGDVLLAYPKKQMGSSRWHLVGDNPSVSSVSFGDRSFFTGMCY